VIPDFVDCQHFAPETVGAEAAAPAIASVGRLSPEKGQATLLRAMPALLGVSPDARVLLCGEGPEQDALRKLASELGISDRVEFLGFVPDVRPVLAAANVFVMPSLTEGLGVAALEAMAMAKPVVASAVGGLPESIADGESGLLVPAGDPEALSAAVLALLRNPGRARMMGAAGRDRALEHYDRPVVVAQVMKLYQEVAAGG
jgi:glycosyltransferase involved in cell wall biosynthesis